MAAPNNNDNSTTQQIERRESQFSFSTRPPVKHKTWDEARNLWKFKTQGRIVVWCQKAPNWLVLPPALFFHFFLKRDWGMAFGPIFAYMIYNDNRTFDLFLSSSLGGVLCGVFKHLFRTPRPFWIVPEVRLKQGVEEMSWGTPSAHSAIQGAISAVLVFYDVKNPLAWVINIVVLLFVMFSRLYLAVHWPQEILGSGVGIIAGLIVCACNIHDALFNFVLEGQKNIAGLIYLAVGFGYFVLVWGFVLALNVVSDNNPCPDQAIQRYKLGVLRALRILKEINSDKSEDSSIINDSESKKSDESNEVEVKEQYDIEDPDSETISLTIDKSMWSRGSMFMPKEEREKKEAEDERRKREVGVFFPEDVKFDPDNKIRFWYNAINVLGAYCGMALFACVEASFGGREWMTFSPGIKWVEAVYAMSFTFALIVYTRTILRSMLPKKVFKWVRMFVFWFIGFFVYGLFPLSYLYVRKHITDEDNANSSMSR